MLKYCEDEDEFREHLFLFEHKRNKLQVFFSNSESDEFKEHLFLFEHKRNKLEVFFSNSEYYERKYLWI